MKKILLKLTTFASIVPLLVCGNIAYTAKVYHAATYSNGYVSFNEGHILDGLYYIKGVDSQKYLQVSNNIANNSQNIEIGTGSGTDGQKWYVTNQGDGTIILLSSLGSYNIDIERGEDEDGANVQLYSAWNGTSQKYKLELTNTKDTYVIRTASSNYTKAIDVYGRGKTDGTNVCQWTYNGNTNQQWIFEKVNSTPTQPEQPKPEQPSTGTFVYTSYPTINADVPDLDIINVNGNYYMVSTTMNMCPGVPIMKSTDLVHWQIVNYVYQTFENDDYTNLNNGKDMYSRGSWAASLKYDESSKMYYVAFNSNNHGFYIYTTRDIENGTWEKHFISRGFHDPALFFENGKMYVISAAGGSCKIQELRLNGNAVETVGSSRTLFTSNGWGLWEGAHAYKVNGNYYVFIIATPSNRWMRTQLCYKTNNLFSGKWEEKIVFQSGVGTNSAGLAQGGIVQAQNGDWYGFMFQDAGAVGRVPSIVAVQWQNSWPMMGTYDANGVFHANSSSHGMTLGLYDSGAKNYIVDNDDFNDTNLKLVWQWNHNPQNNYWSLTENPGYLRLKTDRIVKNIYEAHNSLTQRTYGNACQSETKIYTDNMKPGDYAGLCAVADHYGMVGVMCNERGERYVYQANSNFKTAFSSPNATSYQKINANTPVYLKISYNFARMANATYYYSLDGKNWSQIGNRTNLGFSTSTTFMGTRTWLFNYSSKQAGGYVDFDYYKIYD